MRHRLAHSVGRSSQATPAAVDKPQSASHTEFLTLPLRDGSRRVGDRSFTGRNRGTDPKAPVANRQPIGGSTLKAVGHATHDETLVPRQRSLIESRHLPTRDRQPTAAFRADDLALTTLKRTVGPPISEAESGRSNSKVHSPPQMQDMRLHSTLRCTFRHSDALTGPVQGSSCGGRRLVVTRATA
jgi:hypothetical protein